jgi:Zn-dependent peptidase ImmA (M78 family)
VERLLDLKVLQRRCAAQLRALALPPSIELPALLERLSAARGRRIVVYPTSGRPGPCGLWISAPNRDYIFYEADTTPLHQAHIVLHELAHLLFGHQSANVLEPELLRSLVPDLEPTTLQRVLRRASYDTQQEQEAELLATMLLQRLAPTEPASRIDPEAQAALEQLARSLEEQAALAT